MSAITTTKFSKKCFIMKQICSITKFCWGAVGVLRKKKLVVCSDRNYHPIQEEHQEENNRTRQNVNGSSRHTVTGSSRNNNTDRRVLLTIQTTSLSFSSTDESLTEVSSSFYSSSSSLSSSSSWPKEKEDSIMQQEEESTFGIYHQISPDSSCLSSPHTKNKIPQIFIFHDADDDHGDTSSMYSNTDNASYSSTGSVDTGYTTDSDILALKKANPIYDEDEGDDDICNAIHGDINDNSNAMSKVGEITSSFLPSSGRLLFQV